MRDYHCGTEETWQLDSTIYATEEPVLVFKVILIGHLLPDIKTYKSFSRQMVLILRIDESTNGIK